MHPQDDSAFRFRTRERKVKTVNFNVGENRPKLIVYHSNVPWTTAKLMHASTTAETLVKIGSVVVAWQSLAYSPASVSYTHLTLPTIYSV